MKTTLTIIFLLAATLAFSQKDTLYIKDVFTPYSITAKGVYEEKLVVTHDGNTIAVPLDRVDSLRLESGRLFRGDQLRSGMEFSAMPSGTSLHKKGSFRFHLDNAGGFFIGAGVATLAGSIITPSLSAAGANPYVALGLGIGTGLTSTGLFIGGGVQLRRAAAAKGVNDSFVIGIGPGSGGMAMVVKF